MQQLPPIAQVIFPSVPALQQFPPIFLHISPQHAGIAGDVAAVVSAAYNEAAPKMELATMMKAIDLNIEIPFKPAASRRAENSELPAQRHDQK